MKTIETVALIGLGSVGSAYISKIADTVGMDRLRVIASGERAERYRKQGVVVNGKKYHFPIYAPEDAVEPADLVIFAVKNHHLQQAIANIRNHVGSQTVIISLLNGITSEQSIAAVYSSGQTLLAYSVKIDAMRSGNEVTYSNLGLIPFGEAVNKAGSYSENVLRVKEFLTRVGIDHQIPEDMVRSQWTKFMLNVGINQVSALLRAPYGAFQRTGEPRALVLAAMREVVALAALEGVNLTLKDADETIAVIDALAPTGKTSMLQDIEAGQKTEVELFGGTVVDMGKKHGVDVPLNAMFVRMLCCLEAIQRM